MANQISMTQLEQTEHLELELILEAIYRQYGYDFRNYLRPSIARRMAQAVIFSGSQSISELQHKLLHDPKVFSQVLQFMSVATTEMFRDPQAFQVIRQQVFPILKTYPSIRIWLAGCATGEEAYSMAILLHEEGLAEKSKIFATDFCPHVLQIAKTGSYSLKKAKFWMNNYNCSDPKNSFSYYFNSSQNEISVKPFLKDQITFFEQNLATDDVFSEFHFILCRNVLIYFNEILKERAINLFTRSLCRRGFLMLGEKEVLKSNMPDSPYEIFHGASKIYRISRLLP